MRHALVHDTQLRGWARVGATFAIVIAVAPMLVANVIGGGGPPSIKGVLAWPGFVGWAVFALLFIWLIAIDVVRLAIGSDDGCLISAAHGIQLGAAMLARLTGGAAATLVVAEVGIGIGNAMRIEPGRRRADSTRTIATSIRWVHDRPAHRYPPRRDDR